MDLGVRDRLYVLVGGSSGMGWETARLLAAEGARIAIISRSPDRVTANIDRLSAQNSTEIRAYAADVSQSGSVEQAIARIVTAQGPPRGLAMTNHWMSAPKILDELPDDDWDMLYQHSLMAVVRTCRTVIPVMKANGGGSIVVTSAYSSRAPKPKLVAYATFKAALNNLVKAMAKTYGKDGIRVNCVAPGAIKTGRYEERLAALVQKEPGIDPTDANRRILASVDMSVALGRYGEPAEVADMITFLLSERAGYTTGLVANVDGGTDF